jgi:ribosomal protein S18 acetylase RimI-like enzyme
VSDPAPARPAVDTAAVPATAAAAAEPGVDEIQASGCRIADWRPLAALVRRCFPDIRRDELCFHLVNSRPGIRLLRRQQRIVAFAINNPFHSHEFAWLELFGVAPELRGHGLGRRMLQDYEHFVAGLGYRRIEFAVDPDNAGALALYQAAGYTRLDRAGSRPSFGRTLAAPAAGRPSIRRPGLLQRASHRLLFRLLVPEPARDPGADD